MIRTLSNLYLCHFQMPIKGGLFVITVTALAMRTCTPIKWSCAPLGFQEFEPLMTYLNAEDTGFLTLYVLNTPKKPRTLERCEKLWRKLSLILMLLLFSGIEQNPGEFLEISFFLSMFILYEQILCACYLSHHLISIKRVQVLKILPSCI